MADAYSNGSVSVIIAAHNAERTISECLDSVLEQDVPRLEVVVCDDGSTDSTADVVRSYNDPRILLLVNEENLGAGPSRDRAIKASTGEWLALIDADDAWLPGRLPALLAVSNVNGGYDRIVFDDLLDCHDSPNGLVPFGRVHGKHAFGARGNSIHVSTSQYMVCRRLVVQPIFSKKLVMESGATHGSRRSGQDLDFTFLLLAAGGKLFYVPEPFYLYRVTSGSLSSRTNRNGGYLAVFEDARRLFSADAIVSSSIERKITSIHRSKGRIELGDYLRQRRYGAALCHALRHPSAAWEFVTRIFQDVPYQLNRLWHRAPTRRKR